MDSESSQAEKKPQKMVIYQMMTRLFGNQKQVNKTYGTLEENGVGKFDDISDKALLSLKELGITHVWYTGIIEHAVLTDYTANGIPLDDADVVKGRAGSPYAIKDYYDVNPDLAVHVEKRMEEFELLVERTHRNDLKVIIDFVPNHVARAYHSDKKPDGVRDLGEGDDNTKAFLASNNFYYLPGESFQVPADYNSLGPDNSFPTKDGKFEETPAKVTGNNQFTASPGINEWFETVKLNYGVDMLNNNTTHFEPIPDTWIKMRDILLYWVKKGVDGFRCDMAEMVPVEFWQWAIPQVKQANENVTFIAEIYNPSAYRDYIKKGGFDFLYDKVQLYDTLRLLINGKSATTDIPNIQSSLEGINANMLHFLENHDEQRIASPFFAGDPWKAIPAMLISSVVDRGPVMIYFGQEVGEPGAGVEGFQGDDGRTTIFDYWGVPEHQKWLNGGRYDGGQLSAEQKKLRATYSKLLNLAKSSPAIVAGGTIDLTTHNVSSGNINSSIYACLRNAPDEVLLVVAGFNPDEQSIVLEIPEKVLSEIGLSSGEINARAIFGRNGVQKVISNKLNINLPPYGAIVFKLEG
ncbi:MAG TPA: alpha-amylase family glycosyl hydrolase [Cyclobacteriaceae bacterium]|nr:alpha-amylase family glycosyl hydrolase [Cyclobacteriaceae bacterium]